jgi:hypothetical protein
MQFLPRQEEVPGWRLEGDLLVFAPEDLGSYIEKDARHFLSYEMFDATVGTYRHLGSNGFTTVEVYRFPDFVKAFGAYSTRRKAARAVLFLGNEGFVGAHSLHIWSGPFYVRMVGGGDPRLLDAMKLLATKVVERMPRAPGKPAVFGFLPESGRVPNSEAFSSEPALGQPVLANAFTASYVGETPQPIDGLILPTPNKQTAAKVLSDYRSFFVNSGKVLDPIVNLGEDNFTAEDRHFGRTVAFRIDRFVIAFRGFGDMQRLVDLAIATDQRILGTIRKQLQTAEKQQLQQQNRTESSQPQEPGWVQQRQR